MPSFYPSTLPRQMPLTPPDQYGTCLLSPSVVATLPPSILALYRRNNRADHHYGMDGQDKFGVIKQPIQSSFPPNRTGYNEDFDRQHAPSFVPPNNYHENAYGRRVGTSLPPMRAAEAPIADEQSYYEARSHLQAQPKEEKAVGGVAAHLDYDMEQMVDFVSEMAQGMYDLYQSRICLADIDIIRSVQPNGVVSIAFRKYVSQILSSTRLPSSTILLGLHYLTVRVAMLSVDGIYASSTGQLYRLLTTALMLGSKFLDDNTFQNRSWSDVSNISVGELNSLELDWLVAIEWDMHIDPSDPQGLTAWLNQWKRWQSKKIERTLDSLKLTPLDTNIQRMRSVNKQLPPSPLYPPSYSDSLYGLGSKDRSQWQTPSYDQWPPIRSMIDRSPLSAPDTGPNTPEWYGRHGSIGYGQAPPAYSMRAMPPPLQNLPPAVQSASYYTPYAQQYTPTWGSHGLGCGCGHCAPYSERCSMAHAYGAQTVAG